MPSPALIAAIASSVAAVLSGLGLWIGARRDERKWRRDAIIDTLVQFLDASFGSPGDVDMRKRRAGGLTEQDRTTADQGHALGMSALTRLRFIASASVVEHAELLHLADDAAFDMVLVDAQPPDEPTWAALLIERRRLRNELLEVSRRDLSLGDAKAIHSGSWS